SVAASVVASDVARSSKRNSPLQAPSTHTIKSGNVGRARKVAEPVMDSRMRVNDLLRLDPRSTLGIARKILLGSGDRTTVVGGREQLQSLDGGALGERASRIFLEEAFEARH